MHYRDIWKKHFGEIPKDEYGISFEIHHIDGDRTNNNLKNLECLSIEQHYLKHLEQGDLNEANAVLTRMKKLKQGKQLNQKALVGTKWYWKDSIQKQFDPADPRILEEGWHAGMHPVTVAKIRKTSHQAPRKQTEDPEGKARKISDSLKIAYKNGTRKKNSRKVAQLNEQRKEIKIWESIRAASKETGIAESTISTHCRKTKGKQNWIYKN